MYPPSPRYSALPTDPEDINSDNVPKFRSSPWFTSFRTRRMAIIIAGGFAVLLIVGLYSRKEGHSVQVPLKDPDPIVFPEGTFTFNESTRPQWLDIPPLEPVILRIAVITRVDGFERRQAIREAVFRGVDKGDVSMVYHFFIGSPPDTEKGISDRRFVEEENSKFNDIVMLDEIEDIPERISEKRYAALKWAGSVSNGTYDYFLTLDSDTFVRFSPLARRLSQLYGDKKINPREDPLLLGRIGYHLTYFLPTVPDGNKDEHEEDEHVKGPWFPYPIGIGYMLSSSLVKILLSTDPPLPHHIHYPSDDVMIGSWIASLRLFHDEATEWESIPKDPNETVHRFYPKPFLPYPIDTVVIDDIPGWHDFPGRGGQDGPISWESVCIHHIAAPEMKLLRERPEFLGEWDSRS